MDLFNSIFSHLFSIHHYFETGSSCGCVNTYALWDIMSKVRDNKRYAIPPIKQIDVTFFPSHVSVNQSQLILTARQKQKRKNKNKNKQTNIPKKGETTLKLILQHFTRFCFRRETMMT